MPLSKPVTKTHPPTQYLPPAELKRLPDPPPERRYRVSELEWTGFSHWTWRKWAYEGRVASVKVGKALLIPASEVERIMAEGYRPALATAAAK